MSSTGNNTIKEALINTSRAVLEDLCFMFAERIEEEERSSHAPDAETKVAFEGPFSGKLVLRAYGGTLKAIACNMLGKATTSEEQQIDAFGEFANVLCGNLLPAISGPKAVFSIKHPETSRNTVLSGDESNDPEAGISFSSEEGDLDILLFKI